MSADLAHADIGAILVRLGIEAKKKGKEWLAVCPNPDHADRSPSWRIRDEPGATKHGYFHCWPCGFKGGLLDLVQKKLGLEDRRAAREWLGGNVAAVAQKPVERVVLQVRRASLGFRLPEEVICAPIDKWPSPAREYWRKRGLEDWQVDRWGVGYATQGTLAARIVLVTRDAKGRPLRYTARTFASAAKRYIEPYPEEKAHEGAMFGEQHWPPIAERKNLPLFLVEGAVNGLALEAEMPGIHFAATAGSSMRGMYAAKIATWGAGCVMTDPDKAGDKLFADMEAGMGRHLPLHRLRLDVGMDPAKLRVLRPGELGTTIRNWLRSWRESHIPSSS